MAGPVAAVWLDRIHFNTFCLSLIRTNQQKDGAQMSKSYRNKTQQRFKRRWSGCHGSHSPSGQRSHSSWLTVNLFLRLLRMHSAGRNHLQMCSLTVFMICVGFCSYLCFVRNHMLSGYSRGSMGLNVHSWISLSATLLLT